MKRMVGVLALARICVTAVQALSLIILARWLSPESFGEFSAVFALQSTIMTLASFGIPRYVLREYAAKRLAKVSRAFLINVFTTIAATGLCVVPAMVWGNGWREIILYSLMGVALGIEKNSELRMSLFIADKRILRAGSGLLLRAATNVILLFAVGTFVDPLTAFVGSRLFAAGVSAVAYTLRSPNLGRRRASTRRVVREMSGIGGTAAIGSLYGADSALMAWAAGSSAAGFFAAATRLVYPLGIFATPMSSVLMPAGVGMERRQLRVTVRRMTLAFVLLYLVAGIIALLGQLIYLAIYGEEYVSGVVIFVVLSFSIPTTMMNPLFETLLQARRDDQFVFVTSTACVVFGRILLVVGGVFGGAVAATAAVVLTSTIQGALLSWRSHVVARR